jgi:RecB family exonuclease
MATSLYRMTGPTSWAGPPALYSFSSLAAIERCPLQWQLIHSRYGELNRFPTRPHPAAVEGEIVHSLLDRVFRTLAVRGMPPFGAPEFREGIAEVDIHNSIHRLLDEHEQLLAGHPRGSTFRLRTGPQQLANRVIRLFRDLYSQAIATHAINGPPGPGARAPYQALSGPALADLVYERGMLSELTLTHPILSFSGTIDLVRSDHGKAVIVDFKTGQARPEHRLQVACYALLWWKCSDRLPGRAEIRYPGRIETLALDEELLAYTEEELDERISAASLALRSVPGETRPGEQCGLCDVRQYCQAYWMNTRASLKSLKQGTTKTGQVDLEVTVVTKPSGNGFHARTRDGGILPIVYREELGPIHGLFVEGERLRILRGQVAEDGSSLELHSWTEVFHGGLTS